MAIVNFLRFGVDDETKGPHALLTMTNRDTPRLRAEFVDDGLIRFSDGVLAMWCDFSAAWRPIAPEHRDVIVGYEPKHTTSWGDRACEYLHAIDVEVESGVWAASMIEAPEGFAFVLFSRHSIAHDVETSARCIGDHDIVIDVADTMAHEDELRVIYGYAGPFATREDAEDAWRDAPGETTECLAWRTRFGWFYASA